MTNQKRILLYCCILFIQHAVGQVTASFNATPTKGCAPLLVAFNNNSSGAQQYQWDFGNGSYSSQKNPSVVFQSSGTYTIKLIASDTLGNKDSIVKSGYINVYNTPQPMFSWSQNGICEGSAVINTSNQTQGAQSYQWNFGDGITSTQTNPTHTYNTAGTYQITLQATSPKGCKGTYTDTARIVIRPKPNSNFNTNPKIACDSSQVFSFQPSISGLSGYSWKFGDGNSSQKANTTHVYGKSGKFPVQLITTNSFGCTDSSSIQTITIHPNSLPTISIDKNNGCAPLTTSFNFNQTGAGNIVWNMGNNTLLTGDSASYTYQKDSSFVVSVKYNDQNGCLRTLPAVDTITVHPNPIASFTPSTNSGCMPLRVNYTNLSSGATQYAWNLGNATTNATNPTATYNKNTSFPVALSATNQYGCTSIARDTIRILNTNLKFTSDYQTGCAPLNVRFKCPKSGITSYKWTFGDGDSSKSATPTHTYKNLGSYNVCLETINQYGCTDKICTPGFVQVTNPDVGFKQPNLIKGCAPYNVYFNAGNKGAYNWLWEFGDGSTSNNKTVSHTYPGSGTYKVYLTSFTNDSCKFRIHYATVQVDSGNADFNYTFQSCTPITLLFTDSSANATSRFWNFGDGTTSTLANPKKTYTVPGIYLVTLKITSPQGCSYTKSKVITTFSGACPPPVNYSPSTSPSSPKNIIKDFKVIGCAPFNMYFMNPFPGAISVHWDFGDGTSSTNLQAPHTYVQPGTYTVKATATLPGNIKDSLIFLNSVKVGLADASFSISNAISCRWDSIVTQPNLSNQPYYKWYWSNGDSTLNVQGNYKLGQPDVAHSIRLNVQDTLGCSASSVALSSYSLPFANIDLPDSLCYNHPLKINPVIPRGYTYSFDYGNGKVSAKPTAYGTNGKYAVSIILTDSMNCSQRYFLDSVVVWSPSLDLIGRLAYCLGDTIQLEAKEKNASYGWKIPYYGATNYRDRVTHYADTTGTFDVELKISKKGCTVHRTLKNKFTVQQPTASFSYQFNNLCSPTGVTFQDTSAINARYQWNSGNISKTGNPVTFNFSAFPKQVKLQVTDSLGCTNYSSQTISRPQPPTILASHTVRCANDTVAFSITGYLAQSAMINWKFGDGNTATGPTVAHAYTKAGSFSPMAIIQYQGSCSDTLVLPQNILVGKPIASMQLDTIIGCAPRNVSFSNHSANFTSVRWNFGDGSYSSIQNPSHLYTSPGTYYPTVSISDSLGCSDSATYIKPVKVLGPIAGFTFTDSVICAGTPISFTNHSIGADTSKWVFGDGQTVNTSNPTVIYADSGTFSVTLIATDTNGCKDHHTHSTTIRVNPVPKAQITLSQQQGCAPLQVQYTANAQADSVVWSFGNNTTSNLDSGWITYNNPGLYHIQLHRINQYGCSDTANTKTVEVFSKPSAQITMDTNRNCYGVPFQLHAHGDSAVHYTWIIDGVPVSNDSVYTSTYAPGSHSVRLAVQSMYGCSDTITHPSLFYVSDTTTLPPVEIKRVTVTSDTSVLLSWVDPAPGRTASFTIQRSTDGVNFTQLAVTSATNWIDHAATTLLQSYCYKVTAVDSCGITSSESPSHCTINVTATSSGETATVTWTPYVGDTPSGYNILRKSTFDTTFTVIDQVPGNTHLYIDSGVVCAGYFTYKIEATRLARYGLSSLSDTSTTFTSGFATSLEAPEIIRASVINDAVVYVEWKTQTTPLANHLYVDLYRVSPNNNKQHIATLPYNQKHYTDENTAVHDSSYTYQIGLTTDCGMSFESDDANSILLKSTDHQNKEIMFRWNPYDGWKDGVERYELQLQDDQGNWKTVTSTKETSVIIDKD